MSIRAVVFDLDGLMLNTEELYQEVGGEILRRRGKHLTQELLDEMMGRRAVQALQIMIDWHDLDATVEQLSAETAEIFEPLLATRLAPMPGFLELLTRLEAADIPRAVATSSPRAFVDRVLSQFDLVPRFAFILTAEDVTQGKPNPQIYLMAAARFPVETREMLVLEDSQIGCQAALAAGAQVVAVPGDHSRNHDFAGVHLVAASLADPRLLEMLEL